MHKKYTLARIKAKKQKRQNCRGYLWFLMSVSTNSSTLELIRVLEKRTSAPEYGAYIYSQSSLKGTESNLVF